MVKLSYELYILCECDEITIYWCRYYRNLLINQRTFVEMKASK